MNTKEEDMKILKSIATIVGVSPRAIASFLIQNGEKEKLMTKFKVKMIQSHNGLKHIEKITLKD